MSQILNSIPRNNVIHCQKLVLFQLCQLTGYELTSPVWLRVDFLGTGWPGYESVRLRVD